MLQQMSLLLVRGLAGVAGVGTKAEMDVVSVTSEPVGEVEDLVTV